jgi:hypothetical protein
MCAIPGTELIQGHDPGRFDARPPLEGAAGDGGQEAECGQGNSGSVAEQRRRGDGEVSGWFDLLSDGFPRTLNMSEEDYSPREKDHLVEPMLAGLGVGAEGEVPPQDGGEESPAKEVCPGDRPGLMRRLLNWLGRADTS